MHKSHVFRLGSSFLLGLIAFLSGGVFFLSNGAYGDSKGTDCPSDWSNVSGFCFQDEQKIDTGGTNSATSPSGKCCTYEVYKVVCPGGGTMGYSYSLNKAGQSGYNCSGGICVKAGP